MGVGSIFDIILLIRALWPARYQQKNVNKKLFFSYYYFMLKTPKLTQKTNFQLVARRSECSDPWIDFKNGFYGPKNPYFDVSYVNKRQFYDFFSKMPTIVA